MATIHATEENFDALVAEGVVLVDFWAPWCGPCKLLARELEELEDELPFVNIVKVDVDQCPALAERFHVNGIPDLYFYQDGQVVTHGPGAIPYEEIREQIARMLY
ncbi:MAG: thioredoxin family protein [Oscillospiraceae bacterium]|nr:thioredoxin family protein [Oscillospiraceae bacterium]